MLPNIHSKIHFNFSENSFSQETFGGYQTFVAIHKQKQKVLIVPYKSLDHCVPTNSSMF
jgi:hypothetical protein